MAANALTKRIADRMHLLKQIANTRREIFDLQVRRHNSCQAGDKRDENVDLAQIEMLEAKIAWGEAELRLLDAE